MSRQRRGPGGFVLHEAVALLVVLVVVVAIFAVLSTRSRSLASLGESMANLRRLYEGVACYGDDNASRFATFSWRKGTNPTPYTDLQNSFSDLEAAANQAVHIIRTRAGLSAATMPKVGGWIPHVSYSHLVLAEYLEHELPMRWMISPEDPKRLAFALDRSQWGGINTRFAFSGSYEVPVAFWSRPDSGPGAIYSNYYNTYSFGPTALEFGTRRLDEVVYPSQKALYYDRHQRHFGPRQAYFMHEEARVPVATVDGTVSVRRGADANPGWQPGYPTSPDPQYLFYNPPPPGPLFWDPPALDPSGQDIVAGRYRFTRKALAGRDVDGPEVP